MGALSLHGENPRVTFYAGNFLKENPVSVQPGGTQNPANAPKQTGSRSDAQERPPASKLTDELLNHSLADTFPSSDPLSIVHPTSDDSERMRRLQQYELIAELPSECWAAISIDDQRVAGTGATREEAEQKARQDGNSGWYRCAKTKNRQPRPRKLRE